MILAWKVGIGSIVGATVTAVAATGIVMVVKASKTDEERTQYKEPSHYESLTNSKTSWNLDGLSPKQFTDGEGHSVKISSIESRQFDSMEKAYINGDMNLELPQLKADVNKVNNVLTIIVKAKTQPATQEAMDSWYAVEKEIAIKAINEIKNDTLQYVVVRIEYDNASTAVNFIGSVEQTIKDTAW